MPIDNRANGFFESFDVSTKEVLLTAWAARNTGSAILAPDYFEFQWGNINQRAVPNVLRSDVASLFDTPNLICGLQQTVQLEVEQRGNWTIPRIEAVWFDGERQVLPATEGSLYKTLQALKFLTYEEYEIEFQNPASRRKSSYIQAYAALRAMDIAGDDLVFWLSGAVVAIYRSIIDNVLSEQTCKLVLDQWSKISSTISIDTTGLLLRWVTSMHLAAGYAHLTFDRFDLATQQFKAMINYTDCISTWPQCLTNLAIGRFLAASLLAMDDRRQEAITHLEGCQDLFQLGVSPLKIWNWAMYEELNGALRASQMCFALRCWLLDDQAAEILPPEVRIQLSKISDVMGHLVGSGRVADYEFMRQASF